MTAIEIELENIAKSLHVPASESWNERPYRCHVCLIPEEDGSFCAVVLNLAGVGSCGDTEAEALENVREAATGAIESFLANGGTIPWRDSDPCDIPKDATQKWILVNA